MLDRKLGDFDLKVTADTPSGPLHFANSGIFFGMQDIRQPFARFHSTENWPTEWREIAEQRSRGWIGTWSGYEVQLLAGSDNELRPRNERNGAIYGVNLSNMGSRDDHQSVSDFRFEPGMSYEVVLKVRGHLAEVYMKWSHQESYRLEVVSQT